jgi:hypothetical protein
VTGSGADTELAYIQATYGAPSRRNGYSSARGDAVKNSTNAKFFISEGSILFQQ